MPKLWLYKNTNLSRQWRKLAHIIQSTISYMSSSPSEPLTFSRSVKSACSSSSRCLYRTGCCSSCSLIWRAVHSLWFKRRPEIIAYVLSLKKECSSFWSLSCRSPGRLHQTTICAYELAFKTLTSEFGCKRLKTRVNARKYSISSIVRTKSCAGAPFGPDERKGRYLKKKINE